jgi:hypothetical protein
MMGALDRLKSAIARSKNTRLVVRGGEFFLTPTVINDQDDLDVHSSDLDTIFPLFLAALDEIQDAIEGRPRARQRHVHLQMDMKRP